MVTGRRWVLKHQIQGEVSADDFQLVEEELPPLKDGQVLVKAQWISVDPYQVTLLFINKLNYKSCSRHLKKQSCKMAVFLVP